MDKILICKYDNCNKHLINPIIFPCGQEICMHHIAKQGEFNCKLCKQVHQMKINGFNLGLTKLNLSEEKKKELILITKTMSSLSKLHKAIKHRLKQTNDQSLIIKKQIEKEKGKINHQWNKVFSILKFNLNKQLYLIATIKNDILRLRNKCVSTSQAVEINEARNKELSVLIQSNLKELDEIIFDIKKFDFTSNPIADLKLNQLHIDSSNKPKEFNLEVINKCMSIKKSYAKFKQINSSFLHVLIVIITFNFVLLCVEIYSFIY